MVEVEIGKTFVAAVRSVGTAFTMASAGMYMHRKNFVTPEGKRMFALLSQQVTIPIFLFSKIVFCNQDWSSEPCPNITDSLADVWMLLFWPAYVVACGFAVGWVAAWASGTPKSQRTAILAACAFGNSTGLPITLLTVIHTNYPSTTKLGRVDPVLFLSVYLLLYPVLQWGIGGWLLAKDDDELEGESDDESDADTRTTKSSIRQSVRHILNMEVVRRKSSLGVDIVDAPNGTPGTPHRRRGHQHLLTKENLNKMPHIDSTMSDFSEIPTSFIFPSNVRYPTVRTVDANVGGDKDGGDDEYGQHAFYEDDENELLAAEEERRRAEEVSAALADEEEGQRKPTNNGHGEGDATEFMSAIPPALGDSPPPPAGEATPLMTAPGDRSIAPIAEEITVSVWETVSNVLSKCLQPPVIGALLGIFVAATPLRGIFVDLIDRDDSAPLEWFFDGLYEIGQAAVPINMIILGINLSASASKKRVERPDGEDADESLSNRSLAALVVAKMIVMPIVGIASTMFFATYMWDLPSSIDASVYLVTMIVFITPTANNVMIMVELSAGSSMKESIARAIGWQYAAAPFLLSLSVAAVVGVASLWLRNGPLSKGEEYSFEL